MVRYERTFNDIRDKLAADEAAKVEAQAKPVVWVSLESPPPEGVWREVPTSEYHVTVAHPSPGSWREAGDDCTLTVTGSVRVLGSTPDLGALIRYDRPRTPSSNGTEECGDGTIAFLPTRVLFNWRTIGSVEAARRDAGSKLSIVANAILSASSSR